MTGNRIIQSIISSAKCGLRRKSPLISEDQEAELTTMLCKLCSEVNNPRIYIDTCTLLHHSGSDLLDAIERILPSFQLELFVPASVLYELENVGNKMADQKDNCNEMLERLTVLEQNGIVRIVLTNSPKFTDAGLLARFVSECQFFDIILLTQDRELANKSRQLTSFLDGCVNETHRIKPYKLTANGGLIENYDSYSIERKVIGYEKLQYPCFYTHI